MESPTEERTLTTMTHLVTAAPPAPQPLPNTAGPRAASPRHTAGRGGPSPVCDHLRRKVSSTATLAATNSLAERPARPRSGPEQAPPWRAPWASGGKAPALPAAASPHKKPPPARPPPTYLLRCPTADRDPQRRRHRIPATCATTAHHHLPAPQPTDPDDPATGRPAGLRASHERLTRAAGASNRGGRRGPAAARVARASPGGRPPAAARGEEDGGEGKRRRRI